MMVAVKSRLVKHLNTEKTYKMADNGVYVFLFSKDSRKKEIKFIIESKYSVKVVGVNTVNLPKKYRVFRGTRGVSSRYKKVYVSVARGMKIEFESNNK